MASGREAGGEEEGRGKKGRQVMRKSCFSFLFFYAPQWLSGLLEKIIILNNNQKLTVKGII